MADRGGRLSMAARASLGAGTAVLLSAGLERCFGLGGYGRIALLGALAGVGAGVAIWYGNAATGRAGAGGAGDTAVRRRLLLAGAIPGFLVFAALFVARILPLIQEELRYSR